MKPINEWTLRECLEYLHDFSWGYHNERDVIREVADRILMLTRWIPVEERLPTKEDADKHGDIYIWSPARPGCLIISVEVAIKSRRNDFTHWKRIDKPEGV